jgi:hypothetical protein
MTDGVVVYDCEIKRLVLSAGEERQDGVEYCAGWEDFTGMGISCICALDVLQGRPRVFFEDNFADFQELVASSRVVVGFNNHRFDDRLCAAHGIWIRPEQSQDLMQIIWQAAGLGPAYQRDSHGDFTLDKLCRANFGDGKVVSGAMAPLWWQAGQYGRVADYCLRDVMLTVQLLDIISTNGRVVDPRDTTKHIIIDPDAAAALAWFSRG